eukprot:1428499-Ditylum_brightwellii.AAC.1
MKEKIQQWGTHHLRHWRSLQAKATPGNQKKKFANTQFRYRVQFNNFAHPANQVTSVCDMIKD